MCQAGYRNVFSVTVAPLRERKDDIPLLASYFLEQSAKRLKLRLPRLKRAHSVHLQSCAWPGNVRELQSVIERATILATRIKKYRIRKPHASGSF